VKLQSLGGVVANGIQSSLIFSRGQTYLGGVGGDGYICCKVLDHHWILLYWYASNFFFFFAFHIHLIINEKAPRGKGWVLRCIKYSMERIVVLSSLYEEIKMGWRFGKIKDLFFR
jgi:hypothetical protein